MALVDADYNLLWIDVRRDGYMSDAMIYNDSELSASLMGQYIFQHLHPYVARTMYGSSAVVVRTPWPL